MKKYELMTIYPIEDEKFKDGTEKVKAVLAQFGATVEKEESYGDRDLAYEIAKQKRGRFVLFTVKTPSIPLELSGLPSCPSDHSTLPV